MKKFLPLIVVALLFDSCQKTDQLTWVEKRLVGSWFYTDVDFTPRWSFRKDITKDYFGQILTFNEDFSFSLENSETGETNVGVWQANQVNGFSSNQQSDQVIASYEMAGTGEIIQMVWDDLCVSKNRINTAYQDKDGYYQFELKRF